MDLYILLACRKKFRKRLQENNIHTHTGDILQNKQIGTLQAMKKNMR